MPNYGKTSGDRHMVNFTVSLLKILCVERRKKRTNLNTSGANELRLGTVIRAQSKTTKKRNK